MPSQSSATTKLPLTKVVVVDTETQGLNARWDSTKVVFCVCCIEVGEQGNPKILRFSSVYAAIVYLEAKLESGWFLVAHNAKFDLGVLGCRGLKYTINPGAWSIGDTMVMAYHRDTQLVGNLSLDSLTGEKTDVLTACGWQGKSQDFWEQDWTGTDNIKHIEDYCVSDLKATWKLYKRQCAWYNQDDHAKYRKALLEIEFPMLSVLSHMEVVGMPVEQSKLASLRTQLQTDLDKHQAELNFLMPKLQWDGHTYVPVVKEYKKGEYKNAKTTIAYYLDNQGACVASAPYVIYNHCPLIPYNANAATGHTWWLLNSRHEGLLQKADISRKTNKPKLDSSFITKAGIPDNLPIAKVVKLNKALSMADSIAKSLQSDGRLHSSFNNCQTRTGRLSSSSPNFQNFPRASDDIGKQFRGLITATPGYAILVADLDKIELCVLGWYMAVVCGDNRLQASTNDPALDAHQINADLWGMTRDAAKKTIFSLAYGATGKKIMDDGNAKSVEEGDAIIQGIYSAQPAMKEVKEKVWQKLRRTGIITNIFGAHVPYPDINSAQTWRREKAERESFNCQIQRTARDIMHKLAIESLPSILSYGAHLVNIVHDEAIVECPETTADFLRLELDSIWKERFDYLKGTRINGEWNKANTWLEAK